MPQTSLGITYPDSSAHTRLWELYQTLAETADTVVADTIRDTDTGLMLQAGSHSAGPSSAASFTSAVTFPTPFGPGPVYVAGVNLNSGSGSTGQWHGRAINITETGFLLFAFGASAGTFTAGWHYLAVGGRP